MKSVEKIGFVGGGNMAEAMIKGLIKAEFPAEKILVSEPTEHRREFLVERYGVETTEDNGGLVKSCGLVVFAIKPQLAKEVFTGIASAVSPDTLLISILAGVATATIESFFSGSPRVVRAMPNTPALVGAAATALCAGRNASKEDLRIARQLFEAVGTVEVVNERLMDAVTGLSGSGPAYIYTVIDALANGGVQEGLSREVAMSLSVQTVLGAAKLIKETGEHPAVLRDKVCSPGGTTIAAVKVLEERGLRATLMEVVSQATRRSKELGEG